MRLLSCKPGGVADLLLPGLGVDAVTAAGQDRTGPLNSGPWIHLNRSARCTGHTSSPEQVNQCRSTPQQVNKCRSIPEQIIGADLHLNRSSSADLYLNVNQALHWLYIYMYMCMCRPKQVRLPSSYTVHAYLQTHGQHVARPG